MYDRKHYAITAFCIVSSCQKFAPRCCVCHEPIMPAPGQEETVRIVALDRDFHVQCYRCEVCIPPLCAFWLCIRVPGIHSMKLSG
ncbi:hypothetical protein GOODEAATRI_013303 [Goodea atripinnis]|uniref:LIM zinc-binding domain-containing protein n=1 Tax=Goodea atripinnis TaxID=208336 RepID=A0ABV0NU74_9TELE